RQRQRRLQAEKENAELHERVRQLQSELSSMQSPNSQPSPLPQRPAAASNPQPERLPPTSGASTSRPQPQRAIRGTDRATRTSPPARPSPPRAQRARRRTGGTARSRRPAPRTSRCPPQGSLVAPRRRVPLFPPVPQPPPPPPAPAPPPAPPPSFAPPSRRIHVG